MLADPALTDEVEQRLAQGESAAAAWMAVIEAAAASRRRCTMPCWPSAPPTCATSAAACWRSCVGAGAG
jgi:hypothetical protein